MTHREELSRDLHILDILALKQRCIEELEQENAIFRAKIRVLQPRGEMADG